MAHNVFGNLKFPFGKMPGDPLLSWLCLDGTSDVEHLTHVWARGDGNETASLRDGRPRTAVSTEVVFQGSNAGQVSLQRTVDGVTLAIVPCATGGNDGGSLALTNFDPRQGLGSVALDDASWSATDLPTQATTGNDTITGFAIAAAREVGGGTVFNFEDQGPITLDGVNLSKFVSDDFVCG